MEANQHLIMPLISFGKYRIKAKCSNCNEVSEIRIKKGITIKEYFAYHGRCPNCGCNMISGKMGTDRDRTMRRLGRQYQTREDEDDYKIY